MVRLGCLVVSRPVAYAFALATSKTGSRVMTGRGRTGRVAVVALVAMCVWAASAGASSPLTGVKVPPGGFLLTKADAGHSVTWTADGWAKCPSGKRDCHVTANFSTEFGGKTPTNVTWRFTAKLRPGTETRVRFVISAPFVTLLLQSLTGKQITQRCMLHINGTIGSGPGPAPSQASSNGLIVLKS